jgi:TRAP-type C4-dicarboxylate transport system substrate-binding protein
MKKIIMLLVAFFCSLALFSTGFAEPIVCKIADPTPKTFSYYQALLTFEKEVEAATGGKVDVQIFGDGVLGRHQTTTESTMMGSIQGTVVTSAWTQNLVKEHKLFTLPFLWPNYKGYRAWLDSEEGDRVGNLLEAKGLKFLGYAHTGWLGVMNSKREIRTEDDFKGLKIRTMPDSVLVDSISSLGCMGIAMGPGELYSAVQQGVIDGVSTAPQFLNVLKLQELSKYYTDLKLHASPATFIVNLKFFNSLSPDIQKAFIEAGKNFEKNSDAYYTDDSNATSDNNILNSVFAKAGVKNYYPTAAEKASYKELTRPVFMKYREQVGPELVDSVVEFLKKYE